MKKIGIITHYYRNLNYGGSLQSYALCEILNQMGYDAQQICYDMMPVDRSRMRFLSKLRRSAGILRSEILQHKQMKNWRIRKKAFYGFQETIPHSSQVYNKDSIGEAGDLYDLFVTGSDQVFNTDWYHPAFFLDFVPAGKKKIAYAASIGKYQLDEKTRQIFEKSLKDFSAISVRERDAVDMVGECTQVPVTNTLDPTMVLTAEQWDELCAAPMIQEPYVFCFLLGEDIPQRELAREYARKKGWKLVTLPHFPCRYLPADAQFGDIPLYDVSPAEFVSLIKNAQVVLTDSFHAIAFSSTYHKEYFVFERSGGRSMRSRVVSLTDLFGCEDHFLHTPERMTMAYMEGVKPIDYQQSFRKLELERQKSLEFLKKAME